MISCTLNNRKYTVDYITGRALREMEPAAKMYGRIVSLSNAALKGEVPEEAKELSIPDAMDEFPTKAAQAEKETEQPQTQTA